MKYIIIIFIIFMSCENINKTESAKSEIIQVKEFVKNDKMDIEEFWKIIEYSNVNSENDSSKKENIIIEKLSTYSSEQIIEFEIIFRNLVIQADDYKIIAAQKIIEGSVSDDSYLYFRCWLIGKGEKIFDEAIESPETLADNINLNEDTDFEELMYVATEAYIIRTGLKVEDDSFPRNIAFSQKLDYDFGAPPTKGTEWNGQDLSVIYPKLSNKFK